MVYVDLIQYEQTSDEVKEVFHYIRNLRVISDDNNFWKCLANHPPKVKRTWESLKEVMAPRALDSQTKEMIYVAVSSSNGCEACIQSNTAAVRKQGMTNEMFGELIAVVRMANETNRLVHGYQVFLDPQFVEEN